MSNFTWINSKLHVPCLASSLVAYENKCRRIVQSACSLFAAKAVLTS